MMVMTCYFSVVGMPPHRLLLDDKQKVTNWYNTLFSRTTSETPIFKSVGIRSSAENVFDWLMMDFREITPIYAHSSV